VRIVFAGTPELAATCLATLIQLPAVEVVACLTQPDRKQGRGQKLTASPVKRLAEQHGFPLQQPEKLHDTALHTWLRALDIDVLVVVAYGLLIPRAILQLPKYGCINLHLSLLPRWRGASPIQQAILAGDTRTGVTVMYLDVGLDTGDIILQKSCPLLPHTNTRRLTETLTAIGQEALTEAMHVLAAGPAVMRYRQLAVAATHAPKITSAAARILWDIPASLLVRMINAYNPWPGAHALLAGQLIKIWAAYVYYAPCEEMLPGGIISFDERGLLVASKEGAIMITELQLANKPKFSWQQLLAAVHYRQLFVHGACFT
jgi:methionyl-tRNA formyltransferase